MKQHFLGAALALGMVGSMALPTATFASRNIIIARQNEQQVLTSLSPADTDAQELLKSLNITIEPTDPLWTDQHFIDLVQKYKEIRAQGLDIVGQVGDLVLQAFDLADLASQIDRPEFQEVFAMTPEQKAQQEELKTYIKDNLEAFKANPEAFLEEVLGNLGSEQFFSPEYDAQAPYAYGYSNPYEAVDAGRIVWLLDESYNPLGEDMTITWEQTYGPQVVWLNTTSKEDAAFIMPSLHDAESDYLIFTVTADNGHSQSSYEVYVYWLRPYEGDVADAYRQVMGREIDGFSFAYWDELHYRGMSVEQIRAHFEIMKQYENQA